MVMKDLGSWFPLTKPYLKHDVPGVDNLAQLLTLPKAYIGHIFSALLPIYRQNRKPDGKRYTNASLLVKVEGMQRVIRKALQKEYNFQTFARVLARLMKYP